MNIEKFSEIIAARLYVAVDNIFSMRKFHPVTRILNNKHRNLRTDRSLFLP